MVGDELIQSFICIDHPLESLRFEDFLSRQLIHQYSLRDTH